MHDLSDRTKSSLPQPLAPVHPKQKAGVRRKAETAFAESKIDGTFPSSHGLTAQRTSSGSSSSNGSNGSTAAKRLKVEEPSAALALISSLTSQPAPKTTTAVPGVITIRPAASISIRKVEPRPPSAPTPQRWRTAQQPVIRADAPPVAPADLHSKVPRDKRQRVLSLYYNQFKRIYAPILSQAPTLAHEHAFKQEAALHAKANQYTYSPLAFPILKNLEKRPVATSITDVGIDGEWAVQEEQPAARAVPPDMVDLCLSQDQLEQNGYPTAIPNGSTALSESIVCERCRKPFTPALIQTAETKKACSYHDSYARITKALDGQKSRVFPCCGNDLNSEGCMVGPHVYKLTSVEAHHRKIPFSYLPSPSPGAQLQPLVGCDCEMSYTTAGMELTRVTFIDSNGDCLLDELVRPSYPVIDLNSRWSGVTSLAEAKFDLKGVHQEMKKFMSRDTIIVGHGLENDLLALRLIHNKIIDTAVLFPVTAVQVTDSSRKHSLRYLADKLLGRRIQTEASGHDSKEDAVTALDLAFFYYEKKREGKIIMY
ncbi:hypothetical protein DFJ73DRAFT_812597 [Zopfochytrium polystomum]|nr:hypothetical protein DFJ73DRAFT_812597 [Zopfochytrium polystomum]